MLVQSHHCKQTPKFCMHNLGIENIWFLDIFVRTQVNHICKCIENTWFSEIFVRTQVNHIWKYTEERVVFLLCFSFCFSWNSQKSRGSILGANSWSLFEIHIYSNISLKFSSRVRKEVGKIMFLSPINHLDVLFIYLFFLVSLSYWIPGQ